MYSLKHSAFMREIVTDPKKHEFYSDSFCRLLDSCVKRVFMECISRRLNRNDPLLPTEVTEHLSRLIEGGGESLIDSYNELVHDGKEIEDLKKCCEAYWQLHDSMPRTLLSLKSLKSWWKMQRIAKNGNVKFLFLVFEKILSLDKRWERHVLVDSICASVADIKEFASSTVSAQEP